MNKTILINLLTEANSLDRTIQKEQRRQTQIHCIIRDSMIEEETHPRVVTQFDELYVDLVQMKKGLEMTLPVFEKLCCT